MTQIIGHLLISIFIWWLGFNILHNMEDNPVPNCAMGGLLIVLLYWGILLVGGFI